MLAFPLLSEDNPLSCEHSNDVRCCPAKLAWIHGSELTTTGEGKGTKQLFTKIGPCKGIRRHIARATPRSILRSALADGEIASNSKMSSTYAARRASCPTQAAPCSPISASAASAPMMQTGCANIWHASDRIGSMLQSLVDRCSFEEVTVLCRPRKRGMTAAA